MVNGTELTYKEFLEEYRNENNKDKSIEIIDPKTNEVIELTEEEFKEMFKDENITK